VLRVCAACEGPRRGLLTSARCRVLCGGYRWACEREDEVAAVGRQGGNTEVRTRARGGSERRERTRGSEPCEEPGVVRSDRIEEEREEVKRSALVSIV
jgi:hypothetical protein